MVSVVRCRCMVSLSSCDKMSVQDTHQELKVTLVTSDVIVKGPRMSIVCRNSRKNARKKEKKKSRQCF